MNLFKFFGIKPSKIEEFSGDRRRAKRYDIPLKINYLEPVTRLEGTAVTRNISSKGLRFPIKTKIPKGTLLNLLVEDPATEKSISARAKVIWIEEFITGDDACGTRYETGVRLLNRRLF